MEVDTFTRYPLARGLVEVRRQPERCEEERNLKT
jgi:hypothetical protein